MTRKLTICLDAGNSATALGKDPEPGQSSLPVDSPGGEGTGQAQTLPRILVRMGDEELVGESYYLGLDPQARERGLSLEAVLQELLQGWIRVLCELAPGKVGFLPFDFSDQYTRWLSVHRRESEADVVPGWAPVEGWAIMPSDFAAHARSLPEFRPDQPVIPRTFYFPRLIAEVRRSLAACPVE